MTCEIEGRLSSPLHCRYSTAPQWTENSEEASVKTHCLRGKKGKEEFYVTLQIKLEIPKLQACHRKQNLILYD